MLYCRLDEDRERSILTAFKIQRNVTALKLMQSLMKHSDKIIISWKGKCCQSTKMLAISRDGHLFPGSGTL